MKTCIVCLLFFISFGLAGQTKFEKEERIKAEEFPKEAIGLLKAASLPKKVKYYKEQSDRGLSYEAKFKKNGTFFSVEFSSDGSLEDVEAEIGQLPAEVQSSINQYLSNEFKKHGIKKIQRQFIIAPEDNPSTILKTALANAHSPTVNYELIVRAKTDKGWQQLEMLFDANGTLLSSKKIVPAPYEHILY